MVLSSFSKDDEDKLGRLTRRSGVNSSTSNMVSGDPSNLGMVHDETDTLLERRRKRRREMFNKMSILEPEKRRRCK